MNGIDSAVVKPDALSPAEIEAKSEQIGKTKANLPVGKTFLLAIMAGLYIGLGGMFMLLVRSDASFSPVTSQLLGGLVFCLGLFLCLAAGAELFTGNNLMVQGSLSGIYGWTKLLKNWVVVYLGNLLGSLLLVVILFFANYGGLNGGTVGDTMITVATAKVTQSADVLFMKGILCNFLVCLAVWISLGCRTVVDKFVTVLFPITAFVACGFEHCVANMFLLFMGFAMKVSGFAYSGTADSSLLDLGGIGMNLGAVTLGNIVGGALLVGVMYWLAYRKKSTAA